MQLQNCAGRKQERAKNESQNVDKSFAKEVQATLPSHSKYLKRSPVSYRLYIEISKGAQNVVSEHV